MLALKVPLKNGERARRTLLESGALDSGKRLDKDVKFIYLPLARKADSKKFGGSLVNHVFVSLEKREVPELPAGASFEVFGTLGLLDFREKILLRDKKRLAVQLLAAHRLTSVFEKGDVEGRYRVRKPLLLAGRKNTVTIIKEHGCVFRVDLAKAYFSTHLSFERQRVAALAKDGENVLVPFAGVGPFAIVIAKACPHSKIIGVELNAAGVKLFKENMVLNKTANVIAVRGDARRVLSNYANWADRVLTPLPWSSKEFLPEIIASLKRGGVLHYYFFAENEEIGIGDVRNACALQRRNCTLLSSRKVHGYSSSVSQYCLDFKID